MAQAVMAECCLLYLLQFHSRLDILTLQQFPLAPYAAQSWAEHYRYAKDSRTTLLDKLALQLLTTEIVYQNCCCLHNPDRRWQGIKLEADQSPSALYYASLMGLSPVVRLLLANGADPNKADRRGTLGEALDAAAYKGNQDVVQTLLDAGAEPNGGYWEGEYGSPIAAAASQGQNNVVKMLLRAGADVNRRGQDGEGSAMFQAVVHRHLETVKMLVEVGASVDAYAGMSGLTYAIKVAADRCDCEILFLLYSKASQWGVEIALKAVSQSGNWDLFVSLLQYQRGRELELKYAALAGWDDLVQQMVDENLKSATYEFSTAPALCQAAAAGLLETTQILYENSVDRNFSSDEVGEAVAAAAGRGHVLVVQYLLDRGADTGDDCCQKALLQAADGGFLSTVQVLLAAGVPANPRAKNTKDNREQKTCLWAAVDREHIEIVRLLLSHGADPDCQYTGMSALATSIKKTNYDLFQLLLQNGASTAVGQVQHPHYDTLALPIHCAASAGNIGILRALLTKDLDIDSALIPDGWTALFHAAKEGHEDLLRLLINEYGADANRRANKGTVAIHTAAYHNHEKCIEVFLDAGVDVNIRGRAGRTALHWAAQEGSIDAVRVLLERNANVFIEEKDNFMKAADIAKAKVLEIAESRKSPYHWKRSCEENYEPILEMLEDRATQSPEDRSKTHSSTFRRKFPSVLRRPNNIRLSPP
ncbi:MAG: hypothetical protein OHK93_005774 [Ramalina farinacea]|uniref:Ankyrin repeat protein n=1 Tax=Ramalina farinacea TaxID=258253 RepID=A0AA43TSE1_9LECA|nr:hypothetical protein [Ramalina farinacea]